MSTTPRFIEELTWRGMLQDSTPEVAAALGAGPVAGYIGFDPTAESLHVGNLATLMLLVQLQRCGHKPVLLVGGATGLIGDPSGKRAERKLLDADQVLHNVACIRQQLMQFLDFSPGPTQAEVVNNLDWFRHLSLLDFLRDVGKHLTVNYMMAKDSVQSRLETGISYTEFTYQLLQAYDFFYLHQTHGVRLQMGGSDQWGNITAGIELTRRMAGADAHGLTCPLLTKADGTKFGKSEDGNIWLNAQMTSPYKFYQFWLNAADEDLPRLLKVFSLRSRAELDALLAGHAQDPGLRAGQKALATELTTRVHGDSALQRALQASEILFGKGTTEQLRALTPGEFAEIFEGVPTGQLSRNRLTEGLGLPDALAETGAAASKSEARRLLQSGAVRVNKSPVQETDALGPDDLLNHRYILLQTGKKKYHLAVFTD
ncbi:MAG: tyrosine--tRNA ligase [Bacteroidetes bacterium]|nr:tyrosine--tRNA ligase [Bacteroidota bacterium]